MEDNNKKNLPTLNNRPLWSFRVSNGKKPRYYMPEFGKYIDSGRVPFYLKRIGMTCQDWYDKHVLGIIAPSDRPKCMVCGSEAKFLGLGKGYEFKNNVTLCEYHSKDAHRICTSIGTKKALSDPLVKLHQSEAQKLSYKTNPERAIHQSILGKRRYEDPNERIKTGEQVRLGFMNPIAKKNLSEGISRSYLNPTSSRLNSIRGRGNFEYKFSKWQNKEIKLNSSWEVKFFIECDNKNEVNCLIRCPFGIRYYNPVKLSECTYLPDFLLNDHYLIEIKPNYLLDDEVNIAKFNAADIYCRENGLEYVILTEDYLFNNGEPFYGSMPF